MDLALPSIYGSGFDNFLPGSPKHRRGLPLSTAQIHQNDTDVHDWLAEIDLSMYADVFIENFAVYGTNFLNRKHLAKLRMQDLPKMGITNYSHEKLIMEHIHHTLQYEFSSPVRKSQQSKKMRDLFPEKYPDKEHIPIKIGKLKIEDLHIPERSVEALHKNTKHKKESKEERRRRRRSFDNNAWQSISHLNTSDKVSKMAVDLLRDGQSQVAEAIETKETERRRRRSFDHDDARIRFGNKAQHADIIHRELHGLQREHLKSLRKMLGAEYAYVMFLHEETHDLLLYSEHTWYRLPMGYSIAGHVAETGLLTNIAKASDDTRFNSNLDKKLGIVSEAILAVPLRGSMGGGNIIGVIQLVNKPGGFTAADEDAVATLVQRIAEDMHSKFKELDHIADMVYGSAVYINEKGGDLGTRQIGSKHRIDAATHASVGQRTKVYEHVAEKPFHTGGGDVGLKLGGK